MKMLRVSNAPTCPTITRVISASMLLIELIREILIGGIKTVIALTSWDWIDANPWAELLGIPWTIVTAGAFILGYKLNGKGLAIFSALTMIYIYIWAVETFNGDAFICFSSSTSFLFSWFSSRNWAYKSKRVEAALNPMPM